jgi:hypothetical protein
MAGAGMIIETLAVPPFMKNGYVVGCEETMPSLADVKPLARRDREVNRDPKGRRAHRDPPGRVAVSWEWIRPSRC